MLLTYPPHRPALYRTRLTRQPAAIASSIDQESTNGLLRWTWADAIEARSSPRKDAPGAARPAELAGTPGGPAQPRNRDGTRARPRLGSRCQEFVLV